MITIQGVDPKMIANNLEAAFPTHPGEVIFIQANPPRMLEALLVMG